ncbi:arsenate reductase family protein [Algirhabdus cladophorae]|uniref:arsenate reductase family protein n=1 Tax=Algirhabdus cladophorae TaxID=3377108 RepID=UPI003B847E85
MKFYGLKACDTCKKALKALTAAGKEVVVTDVRADGVKIGDLQRFYDSFGENLVNKRSTTWRNMSQEEREQPVIDQLVSNPTLMKRPVIESDGRLYLGWTPEVQSALL